MKDKSDHADSSLSETMAARIEIKELGDPNRQKEITDAVEALDGVIELEIAKGALHVSFDPLATTEKKIEGGCSLYREYNQSCGHRQRDSASRPTKSGECGSKSGNQNFLIF